MERSYAIKNANKANKTIGFLLRNLKYCSTKPRGLQLNTSHQYGTVIEAKTLCRLKWFRGEQLVGCCHITIVRTMCLICLVALDWKTDCNLTKQLLTSAVYKFTNNLAKGDGTELRPVAYSPTRSSGHAFKLPVIKYDFYEFSKST